MAHRHGIVTSASLMVRWKTAAAAAAYARAHPELSMGLHLDLCEWTRRDGEWAPLYEVVPLDDRDAVTTEVSRQLALFRTLVGRGPTHLDSHQHVHRDEPVRSVADAMAQELGVPLRGFDDVVQYSGVFYGQSADGSPYAEAIRPAGLIRSLTALPPGVTELGCHPAHGTDLDSMYGPERETEVDTLCHATVKQTLMAERIELCSFSSLPPSDHRMPSPPEPPSRPDDRSAQLKR